MWIETLEYLGIAFVSSVLLIIMSKIILQALIRRPADYYSAEELRQEELMLNAGGISITKEHETNPEGENIEDSHLEPQLGDFEAAEPEEIITEIPEGVHESVEVESSDDGEVEIVIDDLSEIEPQPEGLQDVTDRRTDDSPIGFKIRAKTSREPEPKKETEEETASVTEINEDGEKARGWTESYADIRKSLEKAFDEHQKPSMRLKKQVLIDIAVARGIEIPDGATKRDILDLINALED